MADVSKINLDGVWYAVKDATARADVAKRVAFVTSMPATPSDGDVVVWATASTADYTQGMLYQYNAGTLTWSQISDEGVIDYDDLQNRPQINNVTLTGNKSLSDLGIDETEPIPTATVQALFT